MQKRIRSISKFAGAQWLGCFRGSHRGIERLSSSFPRRRPAGAHGSPALWSTLSCTGHASTCPDCCPALSLTANALDCSMVDCRKYDGSLGWAGDSRGANCGSGHMRRDGRVAFYRCAISLDRSPDLFAQQSKASIRPVPVAQPCSRIGRGGGVHEDGARMGLRDACLEGIT